LLTEKADLGRRATMRQADGPNWDNHRRSLLAVAWVVNPLMQVMDGN
jgi:hypothetical protein